MPQSLDRLRSTVVDAVQKIAAHYKMIGTVLAVLVFLIRMPTQSDLKATQDSLAGIEAKLGAILETQGADIHQLKTQIADRPTKGEIELRFQDFDERLDRVEGDVAGLYGREEDR